MTPTVLGMRTPPLFRRQTLLGMRSPLRGQKPVWNGVKNLTFLRTRPRSHIELEQKDLCGWGIIQENKVSTASCRGRSSRQWPTPAPGCGPGQARLGTRPPLFQRCPSFLCPGIVSVVKLLAQRPGNPLSSRWPPDVCQHLGDSPEPGEEPSDILWRVGMGAWEPSQIRSLLVSYSKHYFSSP